MPLHYRLHVVYAGRGDAMILSVQDTTAPQNTRLYLLDGGPFMQTPYAENEGPYHKLYASVLREVSREIGRPAGSVKLDAVFLTHAHEDHYGGLLRLFDDHLTPQAGSAPVGDKRLVFNGPFVTQPLPDQPEEDGQGRVMAKLEEFGFRKTGSTQPPDAFVYYQNRDENGHRIRNTVYVRPAPRLLERMWTIDDSVDNLVSLLMFHGATRMLFTGDGVGYKILRFAQRQLEAIQQADQRFITIFKVPHHGSLRNSQRIDFEARLSDPTLHALGMYIVAWGYRNRANGQPAVPLDRFPTVLRNPLAIQNARDALRTAVAARDLDYGDFCDRLLTIADALYGNVESDEPDPFDVLIPQSVAGVWSTFFRKLEGLALQERPVNVDLRMTLTSIKARGKAGAPKSVPNWFPGRLSDAPLIGDRLGGMLASRELRAFFTALPAKNYVISANGQHGHPGPETIAAIAASANAAARNVTIFVTTGACIDLEAIARLEPNWANRTTIKYLSSGARIQLDPTAADPQVGNCATQLTAFTSTQTLSQISRSLESYRGPSFPVGVADRQRCFASRVGGRDKSLQFGQNGFTLSDDQVAVWVRDGWIVEGGNDPSCVQLSNADRSVTKLVRLSRNGDFWRVCYSEQDEVRWVASNDRGYSTDRDHALDFRVGTAELAASSVLLDEPATSLRAYCEAAGIAIDTITSALAALDVLIGALSFPAVRAQFAQALSTRVLGFAVDLDASTVTCTDDSVTAASLIVQIPTGTTFRIDDEARAVASVRCDLTWQDDLAIDLSIGSIGIAVKISALVPHAARSSTFVAFLRDLGMSSTDAAQVTAGALLTYLVGDDSVGAAQLFQRMPGFLLTVTPDITAWTIDTSRSWVETQRTASGKILVVAGEIVLNLPSAAIPGQLADLGVRITGTTLELSDGDLSGPDVAFVATASIGSAGVRIRIDLSDDRPRMQISLGPTAAISDLIGLLPGLDGIADKSVPVFGQALRNITLGAPSISVSQPIAGVDDYKIDAVSVTAQCTSFGAFLPAGIAAPATASATITVHDPLDADARRIGVAVTFSIPLPRQRFADLRFSAWPLPDDEASYAYGIAFTSNPDAPCTISELFGAIGCSAWVSAAASHLPLISDVLSHLAVADAQALVKVTDGAAASWEEISLSLALAEAWSFLDGKVVLQSAWVDLAMRNDEWSGSIAADMVLNGTNTITGELKLPTQALPGRFKFGSCNELSVAGLAQMLGLGDWSSLPVVGPLLSLSVKSAELGLAYPQGASSVALTDARVKLTATNVGVGLLQLQALAIHVEHTFASGETPASTGFAIEAEWDANKIATLSYDPAESLLIARIRLTNAQSLRQMLSALLGTSVPNALLPLIGDLSVQDGSLMLDTADYSLSSFRVALEDDASVRVSGLSLGSLVIEYAKAKGEEPERYQLVGTLQGDHQECTIKIDCRSSDDAGTHLTAAICSTPDTAGLTLRGLLSAFSIVSPATLAPDGVQTDTFFDVRIDNVAAELERGDDGFTLRKLVLDATTTSSLTILSSPPIELTGLLLHVAYDASQAPATSGEVRGRVVIAGVQIDVAYRRGADGDEFLGEAAAAGSTPDFRYLLDRYPGSAQIGIPADLNTPDRILLSNFKVRARPGHYIEVSAFTPAASWTMPAVGWQMSCVGLGGRLRIDYSSDPQTPTRYTAWITGRITVPGWANVDASLQLGDDTRVLSAAVTSPSVQLPGMLEGLAQNASGEPPTWNSLVPAQTGPIAVGNAAYLQVDLRQRLLAFYGVLQGYGTALLMCRTVNNERRVLFAFGLGTPFRFGRLWSALAPLDDIVSLSNAGAVIVAYNGATGSDVTADIEAVRNYARARQVDFAAPIQPLLIDAARTVGRGTTLFADLDLGSASKGLTKNLSHLADGSSPPDPIKLRGLFGHDDPLAGTTYEAAIPAFTLLGGCLRLSSATLSYTHGAQTQQLEIAGTLQITLGNSTATFSGRLRVNDARAWFTIEGDRPDVLTEPLGMVGVNVRQLQLDVEYTFANEQPPASVVEISGKVGLAGIGSELDGSVLFVDGVPQVVQVTFAGQISIRDVFADFIGAGASWPSGWDPLRLTSGSVYYARNAAHAGSRAYAAGYHVSANVAVFGQPVLVDVTIVREGDRKGVTVAGHYLDAIDLHFIKFTDTTLSISTLDPDRTTYSIATGISLFNFDAVVATFAYQSSQVEAERKFHCRLLYPHTLLDCPNPTIEFDYSEAGGLQITNWPVSPDLADALRWMRLIEQAGTAQGDCAALTDLANQVSDDLLKTKLSGSIKTDPAGAFRDGAVHLQLTGHYTIYVAGRDLAVLDLPPIPIVIQQPGSTTIAGLLGWIVTEVGRNAVTMAADILTKKEVAAVIFAELVVSQARKEIIASLVCRDIKPPNVQVRARQLANEAMEEATPELDAAGSSAAEAAAASAMAALAGAVAEAQSALAAALAIIAWLLKQIFSFLGSLFTDAEAARDRAQAAVDDANRRMQKALAMRGSPSVQFNNGVLAVSWQNNLPLMPDEPNFDYAGYAGFRYQVTIASGNDFTTAQVLQTLTTSDNRVTVQFEDERFAHLPTVYCRVSSLYDYVDRNDASKSKTYTWNSYIVGSATHMFQPEAPASVALAYDAAGDALIVTLATVAYASLYQVDITDAAQANAPVKSVRANGVPGSSTLTVRIAVIDLPPLAEGAVLAARAKVPAQDGVCTESPTTVAPQHLQTFVAPTQLAVVIDDALGVSWQAVPQAAAYEVAVLNAAGQPLTSHINVNAPACSVSGVADDTVVRIAARAATSGDGRVHLWSTPVIAHVLPRITNLAVLYGMDDHTLQAHWDAVTGATSYSAELRAVPDTGNPLFSGSATQAQLMLPAGSVTAGVHRIFRVRAVGIDGLGRWQSVAFTPVDLPAPASISLTFDGESLAASWAVVAGAERYKVLLLEGSDAVIQTSPQANSASLGPPEVSFIDDHIYTIEVRAVSGVSIGRAARTSIMIPKRGPVAFDYTGADQVYTVPPAITRVRVRAIGAAGGGGRYWSNDPSVISPGGNAGIVEAVLRVTPGQVLTVKVGGAGQSGYTAGGATGGWNGGGRGGLGNFAERPYSGGGGGGASSIVNSLGNVLVIAGGGGGGGCGPCAPPPTGAGSGGDGGVTGKNGGDGYSVMPGSGRGGGGATAQQPGAGGVGAVVGQPGAAFVGGAGGDGIPESSGYRSGGGGGGGAGFFGGGGGSAAASPSSVSGGGGGGGSSWVVVTATEVSHGVSDTAANGSVCIEPLR